MVHDQKQMAHHNQRRQRRPSLAVADRLVTPRHTIGLPCPIMTYRFAVIRILGGTRALRCCNRAHSAISFVERRITSPKMGANSRNCMPKLPDHYQPTASSCSRPAASVLACCLPPSFSPIRRETTAANQIPGDWMRRREQPKARNASCVFLQRPMCSPHLTTLPLLRRACAT